MTDRRARLAAREPMTVEEEAEELLRRQRAGLIRQVDVGPCSSCDGKAWFVEASFSRDKGASWEDQVLGQWGTRDCPVCNGTGRRYRSRLELAAFCGHEAARLAIGYDNMGIVLGWTQADEDYRAWWECLRVTFGEDAHWLAIGEAVRTAPGGPWVWPAYGYPPGLLASGEGRRALIRWALEEL